MFQPSLLLLPMFLLIFGPKSNGWLDVVSLTSALLIVVHFFVFNGSHIPLSVKQRIVTVLTLFSLLFVYAVFRLVLHPDASNFQVLRFGRVIVNYVGVVSLASIYFRRYGHRASQVLIRHLFDCLVVHAVVMLAMFYSPSFRDLIVNQVVQADPDSRTYLAKLSGYRIAGLTDSWDALSGLQSLGLLMLPILLTHESGISYGYATLAAPLLVFSVAISGRTGFITTALLCPVAIGFTEYRRVHRTALVAIALAIAAMLVLMGPLRESAITALDSSSLGRTFAMFGWNAGPGDAANGYLGETFRGILQEHYFIPDTWSTFCWGSGGSGRDSWDYIPADNGLVLNLHNLGIGCFILIYSLVASCWLSGWRVRDRNRALAGLCLLSVSLMLLIDLKVMYVFSRNGFTAMMLPVLASWFEAARNETPLGTVRSVQ